jgi:hypothetical protein
VRRLLIVLLCSALIVTACGGSSDKTTADPEGTLLVAFLKLQNSPSTVTLSLHSDPGSLQALAAESNGSLGTKATTILNSSITMSHSAATDPRNARSETIINVGGDTNAIETRMVNRTLYLRLDAAGLLKAIGKSPSELQSTAKQAKAAGLKFVGPALAGKWLSVAGADKLAGQSGLLTQGSSQQKNARDAFLQRLLSSATVTTVGTDSAGTHMAINVPARQAYAGFRDMFSNLGGGMPPGLNLPDPSSVPDKNIKVDAWVRDGKLTQLEIDLRQFAALGGQPLPAGVHVLALRMTIHDFTGTIEAPAGAVPVDIKQLSKMFMGTRSSSMSVGGGSSEAPGTPFSNANCAQLNSLSAAQMKAALKSLPHPMLKMLAKKCPKVPLKA